MEKAFVFAHQRANGFSSLEASLAQPTAKVSSLVCWFVCSFLRFLLPHLPSSSSLLLDSIVELCFLRRGRSSCRYFYGSTMLHLAFRLVMNNWVLSYFYSSILPFLCALLSRNDSTVKNLKKKALIQIIVGDSKKEKAAQLLTRRANYKRFCKFFATEHEQKLWKICEMSSEIIRKTFTFEEGE